MATHVEGEHEHAEGEHEHFAGSNKLFISVWFWLLLLTGLEVFLGYVHLNFNLMLTILIGLSVIKAALIIAYFMHLRFERLSLVLTLVPMLVICICLLLVFFPDSFRSKDQRYKFEPSTQAGQTGQAEH
jgi:cytochrome c oxidase subunit 4